MTASGDPDVTIVFRGALPGEKLTQVTQRLADLLDGIDPKPNVAIHPKSFRDHQVTLGADHRRAGDRQAHPRHDPGRDLSRARRRRERHGSRRRSGPVSEIIEPDLVELIEERIAEVDVESPRQGFGRVLLAASPIHRRAQSERAEGAAARSDRLHRKRPSRSQGADHRAIRHQDQSADGAAF